MKRSDRIAVHQPAQAPVKPPLLAERKAHVRPKRFASIWIDSGAPRVLAMHMLRKGAEARCREMINEAVGEDASPTLYYIWDTFRPWEPANIARWTPIAERPRDQWWEGRVDTEGFEAEREVDA